MGYILIGSVVLTLGISLVFHLFNRARIRRDSGMDVGTNWGDLYRKRHRSQ